MMKGTNIVLMVQAQEIFLTRTDASALGGFVSRSCAICLTFPPIHPFPCSKQCFLVIHVTMRQTLRRSCDACARSKLRCDLQLPQCSRCQKRSPSKLICVYANAPLSSSLVVEGTETSGRQTLVHDTAVGNASPRGAILLMDPGAAAFDPFDSHPQTRLPRVYVQRLIHHCKFMASTYPCKQFQI